MADQMESAASSETVQGQESQQEFPIRKNATRSRSANRVVRRTFAFLRHQSLTLIWAEEKEKNPIIFDRVIECLLCSRLLEIRSA
jgi:hypothetical protein